MVDSIKINGEQEWEYGSIQATEDGTPRTPVDADGGFPELTIEAPERQRSRFIVGEKLDISIDEDGVTQGDIYSVETKDGWATVKAFGLASILDVERTALPFSGTVKQALDYYFGLAGYTGKLVISSAIASQQVKLLGFYGNLFDFVNKQLCPMLGAEMTQIADEIIFRQAGVRSIDSLNDTARTLNVEANKEYTHVSVTFYEREEITNKLVLPKSTTRVDYDEVISVNHGETVEKEFELNASLSSVKTPAYNSGAGPYPKDDTTGEFRVIDKEGKTLTNAQWKSGGGKIEVEIGEDTKTLIVRITGPKYNNRSPFKVGYAAGGDRDFPTLRIVGTGMRFNKKTFKTRTPGNPETASDGYGLEIEDECIDSYARACTVAANAAATVSGNSVTLGVENASFGDDALGNVAGARVRQGDSIYRVTSATLGKTGWSYDAVPDTTYSDFKVALDGATYDDFKTLWGEETYADFLAAPLRGTEEKQGSGFGIMPFGTGPFGR